MVATLAQAASAAYYLESQRSFRHPNEYYTAGEEPDGVWFNPRGLLGLENGGKVDSSDFHRLYNGFSPDGSQKLTRNAGSENRSAGLDMTFSADKSVSALWAVADPELRSRIEDAHNAAARVALEETVLRYCSYTRIRDREGRIRVLPADIPVAMFQHGTSRENDPQLHTHCVIFNAARTQEDGKWRAMHQYPAYSWAKAAGAVYRNALAWNLRERLGVRIEQYGPDAGFTRIEGMPEDLQVFWSKRRKTIVAKAGELGIPARGNASRLAGVNKLTRAGKSHDNDPEIRHGRWREEAQGFAEREALIAAVTGNEVETSREAIRELTARLDDLPEHLAREEAVFRRPDMVEAAANVAAGLIGPEALKTAIERLRRNPEIERLEPKKPTAESLAGMAHTEVYSTRHNLGLEQAVKDMASSMAADTGCELPEAAVRKKVRTLLADGYPLSQEQSLAIRHATVQGGRVAVIEGAAGSGKTTTLRPITDLHREHGYEIVPTAVAWRTAVALGDDCDARPYCVDKLLKLAAKGQLEIGRNTLIVVDEAGMLSTRQAHHILQLSERHGAKVVFAGDTRQQQPVEAGPGLRLIRDVAGSVRVDRIRRQKADLEDVLVHVHKETPEQVRFRAGLTSPQERDAILAHYEAMDRKPLFTPWQVAVSEALRDGEAAQAIEAWHLRNRLHLHYDEEKTLTGLVDDWARLVKAEPEKSAVVLARTKAEARALSWLMRERVLGGRTDIRRAVIEVSRDLDGRVTEPLEIAVGDRLRIGATQWEKQLFNGTVVTVEDLEVRHEEGAAVTRKARNRLAGGRAGRDSEPDRGDPESEKSVHITARTDDGRRVQFRHDEIRDFHDNIRLDYGYATTIASAQGLTVDRAFLLADDRPSRETIYPAATRHREGIDVYVNRSPIVFDIADSRPEDQEDMPVTDSEVRAYLAERWSRSRPKEAALDYVAHGEWRDARERARLATKRVSLPGARLGRGGTADGGTPTAGTGHDDPGERAGQAAAAQAPANDNAIVRVAREIRHAVNGWRHGAAVDAFEAERAEVMAAWDELRRRARAEGDAVALSPTFRETLDRHGALMKQAASFRRRPQVFERLLAERAGIGEGEIEELRKQHARAGKYLRSVTARAAHRTRQVAKRQDAPREEQGVVEALAAEAVATGIAAPAVEPAPEEALPPRPSEAPAPGPERDAPPDWRTLYRELQRDWNDLVARSEDARAGEPDLPLLLMDGYDALIRRVRALAEHPDLSGRARNVLDELLEFHDDETAAQETAGDYLAAAERHVEAYKVLERQAGERGIPVARLDAWPEWREAAELLAATGKAVLANEDRYGAWLDAMTIGRERARLTVEQLRNRLDENRTRAVEREVRQSRREPTPGQEKGFAHTLDESRKPRTQRGRKGEEEKPGFAHKLDRPPAKPLDPSERQKGFAHILDDAEKLRKLREKAEERDSKLASHMRRSRGLSM